MMREMFMVQPSIIRLTMPATRITPSSRAMVRVVAGRMGVSLMIRGAQGDR